MTIKNACLTNFQQCKILFYDENNFLKKKKKKNMTIKILKINFAGCANSAKDQGGNLPS